MHINKRIHLLFVILICFFSSTCFAIEYPCEGIANAANVRVRKKASTSGTQIATLDKGESVTVFEAEAKQNGDVWYKIETAKGKQGYVLSDYLSIPEKELIQAAQNSPNAVLMNVKITASCNNYNSVGKNWTQYYEWNGIQAKDGKMEAYVAPGVDISLYTRVREQDKKPDTNTEKTLYTPTDEDMKTGFEVTQKIKVTENAGRYSGNSATWTITYRFTPAK